MQFSNKKMPTARWFCLVVGCNSGFLCSSRVKVIPSDTILHITQRFCALNCQGTFHWFQHFTCVSVEPFSEPQAHGALLVFRRFTWSASNYPISTRFEPIFPYLLKETNPYNLISDLDTERSWICVFQNGRGVVLNFVYEEDGSRGNYCPEQKLIYGWSMTIWVEGQELKTVQSLMIIIMMTTTTPGVHLEILIVLRRVG